MAPAAAGNTQTESDDMFCRKPNDSFFESWKLSVETNNVGAWDVVPKRCVEFVKEYMNGDRYRLDSEIITDYALKYANSVDVNAGDGKHAWIFDVDETLLSNLPYFADHGFGSQILDDDAVYEWEESAQAPALPASLRLYTKIQQLGFKIFLLTGRVQAQRKSTEKNLQNVGFNNYEKFILRSDSDIGKSATMYKSEKRQELVDEGYIIHGNCGDQWTDLLGFATAKRSFKFPNPLYYVA